MARLWTIAKAAALNWSRHKDARQGAALAYYSVFSIGPVIVIAIAVAGVAFGRDAVNGEVAASIKGMLGDTGANAVQAMLADAGRPRQGCGRRRHPAQGCLEHRLGGRGIAIGRGMAIPPFLHHFPGSDSRAGFLAFDFNDHHRCGRSIRSLRVGLRAGVGFCTWSVR
jgi:hypothetical protein